jgi:hypothetical protein
LQYNRPQNADLVREALTKAGRTDLIGFGPECLVRPAGGAPSARRETKNATKPQKSGHASSHYGKRMTPKDEKKETRGKKEAFEKKPPRAKKEHPTARADAKRTQKPTQKRKK